MDKRFSVVTPLVASALLLAAAMVAFAQNAEPATKPVATERGATTSVPAGESTSAPALDIADKKLADLWTDFVHYLNVARPDLAISYGQAILNKNPKPEDLYALTQRTGKLDEVLSQGNRNPKLKAIIGQIMALVEKNYKEKRDNPELIEKAITSLGGGLQAYENGSKQLVVSGEYALPQMIAKLMDSKSSSLLKERIVTVLPKLGKDAVPGLSAALAAPSPELQEILANTLRKIQYRHAAPYLKELSLRKGILDKVRLAADAALETVVDKEGAAAKGLAELAFDSAQRYYNNEQSLQPGIMPSANVWNWQEGLGLTYKPVPREIYTDVYAMRLAKMALAADPKMSPAMELWLAAYLKREADLPKGAKDILPEGTPSARFFALASPPDVLQKVLEIGMKDKNTPVALGAMEALVKTQGAKSLVQALSGGVQPLVAALNYPDRNVRFLAAISLASAMPEKKFSGSDSVIFVLNETLRLTGKKTAMLIAADEKRRAELKDAARAAGYDVVEGIEALSAAKSPEIDVVILVAQAADQLAAMRKNEALTGMPVIVMDAQVTNTDNRTTVLGPTDKLTDVMKGAGAVLPAEQAAAWAVRAADAIALLAMTNNAVYDLSRLRPSLLQALSSPAVEVQLAAAKALAAMASADAQQGVAALALKTEAEKTKIDLLNILTDSIRKFGNQLTEAQVQGLFDLVSSKGTAALREAAAQALGALNLPSDKSKGLILQMSAKE